MIAKERIEEIESYWWSETNDEESQEWRDDLNEEEKKYVDDFDKIYDENFDKFYEKLKQRSESFTHKSAK